MTIDECVRVLAEKLEPSPIDPRIPETPNSKYSPLGFWYWRRSDALWKPRNPLKSAECSERLLEVMPYPSVAKLAKLWYAIPDNRLAIKDEATHSNRRMAIFLAALKWQRIEEPK